MLLIIVHSPPMTSIHDNVLANTHPLICTMINIRGHALLDLCCTMISIRVHALLDTCCLDFAP